MIDISVGGLHYQCQREGTGKLLVMSIRFQWLYSLRLRGRLILYRRENISESYRCTGIVRTSTFPAYKDLFPLKSRLPGQLCDLHKLASAPCHGSADLWTPMYRVDGVRLRSYENVSLDERNANTVPITAIKLPRSIAVIVR